MTLVGKDGIKAGVIQRRAVQFDCHRPTLLNAYRASFDQPCCYLLWLLQMDNMSIGEGQCLNTEDGEVLTGGSEVNGGNPTILGRNRDTGTIMIGLVVEHHAGAGTRANNRIVAMGTDVKLVIAAAAKQRAAAISRSAGPSGIHRGVVTSGIHIFARIAAGTEHIVVASSGQVFATAGTTLKRHGVEGATIQRSASAPAGTIGHLDQGVAMACHQRVIRAGTIDEDIVGSGATNKR